MAADLDRVGKFGLSEFSARLANGLGVRLGPFSARITSTVEPIVETLYELYRDCPVVPVGGLHSIHPTIRPVRDGFPKYRRLVRFEIDGRRPHEDMPLAHALPVLEWGINLLITVRSHAFVMLHAAVVERDGRVLVMPAAPGMGKTTLCAALSHNGWRLFSDEFGLVRTGTDRFLPMPRPMALKNRSIDVIRSFCPDAWIGPSIAGTRKGTVAHVRPRTDSVLKQEIGAKARFIVFPEWVEGAKLQLEPLPLSDAFMMLASNSFNYEMLGESGFLTLYDVVRQTECYKLVYSDLGQALACFDQLANEGRFD